MNGFVAVHIEEAKGDVAMGKKIMECFDPARLPALTTLAREFCVCDRWFSAVPGPTWLNRLFVHAATCDGMIIDTAKHNYRMKTIYDALGENRVVMEHLLWRRSTKHHLAASLADAGPL